MSVKKKHIKAKGEVGMELESDGAEDVEETVTASSRVQQVFHHVCI